MRAAATTGDCGKHCFVLWSELPCGFSEQGLAVLSVWIVLSVGQRFVVAWEYSLK